MQHYIPVNEKLRLLYLAFSLSLSDVQLTQKPPHVYNNHIPPFVDRTGFLPTRSLLHNLSDNLSTLYLFPLHNESSERFVLSVIHKYWNGVNNPDCKAWGRRISALICPPKSGRKSQPSIRPGVAVRPIYICVLK